MSPAQNRIEILRDRAAMLSAARHFFAERSILEVDCPLVSARASVDAHIDLIPVDSGRFLHSSPEYGMKRLLSEGIGDIFQLSHVFRREEYGRKHNPEFMMAEWYRVGFSFQEMIEETSDFIRLFTGPTPSQQMSYHQMFLKYADIDLKTATQKQLQEYCENHQLAIYENITDEGIDGYLNLILGSIVEPKLGKDRLFVVTHYPASQCALAQKTTVDGIDVAERFEIYYEGLELANGYHELGDYQEQSSRLHEANNQREVLGKSILPVDQHFLDALKKGLPDCCGVAVGFDRCMMLRQQTNTIANIIPFDWNLA